MNFQTTMGKLKKLALINKLILCLLVNPGQDILIKRNKMCKFIFN